MGTLGGRRDVKGGGGHSVQPSNFPARQAIGDFVVVDLRPVYGDATRLSPASVSQKR